jgi:eukaryotic-like serine/threonine-protein kinase
VTASGGFEETERGSATMGSIAPEDDLPEIGAIVGKFRLDCLLGIGAFAVVYRGTHLALSMPVALKFLRPHLAVNRPGLVRQLHSEAELAARINHANVVRILDIGDTSGLAYVVMEFVDGESLSTRIAREGRLAPAKAVEIIAGAAKGLRAGSEAGLIHRDVKPANILLSRTGEVKLADFGLAMQQSTDTSTADSESRTIIGTPAYLAPEQASMPLKLDVRADIYALGGTFYHTLTGVPPYPCPDVRTLLREKQTKTAPDVRTLVPSIPADIANLVALMLQRDREKRPSSMAALGSAIDAVQRTLRDV